VAEKLSGLPETIGKEESHGHGRLPLRQVRLEGLSSTARPIPFDFGELTRWNEGRGRLQRS
jgi:hypothetical protein